MSGNEEFVQEFLVECEENLDQLDQDLVALEKTPGDPQRLASIFRTIHTIKGTSGFFGFAKFGALAHSGENLLGRLRDGLLTLTPDIATGLLGAGGCDPQDSGRASERPGKRGTATTVRCRRIWKPCAYRAILAYRAKSVPRQQVPPPVPLRRPVRPAVAPPAAAIAGAETELNASL